MERPGVPATHARLQDLAAELAFDEPTWRRSLEIAGLAPGARDWQRYLHRFLVTLGSSLLVAGATAFLAWNWADLHRLAKLALVQVGVIACVGLTWSLGLDRLGGRASLCTGAVCVGLLLAVFGQAYQTGADPYGLFLGWAALILPWAWIGRQPGLWLLFVLLLDLGLVLLWIQVLDPPTGVWQATQLLGPLVWLGATVADGSLASLLFALNVAVLVAWELGASAGVVWLRARFAPRLIALIALYSVLGPTLILILDGVVGARLLPPVLYAASLLASLWFYQYRTHDLLMLTLAIFGAIAVVMSLAARSLFEGFESGLLLAFLLIAQVAGAARWLRSVSERWEASAA